MLNGPGASDSVDDEPEHWLGPVIDIVMVIFIAVVVVGTPIWTVIHFWN